MKVCSDMDECLRDNGHMDQGELPMQRKMVGNFGNGILRKYGRRSRTKAAGEEALVGVALPLSVPVGILHDCIEPVSPSSLDGL